jgi:hypothetical protein
MTTQTESLAQQCFNLYQNNQTDVAISCLDQQMEKWGDRERRVFLGDTIRKEAWPLVQHLYHNYDMDDFFKFHLGAQTNQENWSHVFEMMNITTNLDHLEYVFFFLCKNRQMPLIEYVLNRFGLKEGSPVPHEKFFENAFYSDFSILQRVCDFVSPSVEKHYLSYAIKNQKYDVLDFLISYLDDPQKIEETLYDMTIHIPESDHKKVMPLFLKVAQKIQNPTFMGYMICRLLEHGHDQSEFFDHVLNQSDKEYTEGELDQYQHKPGYAYVKSQLVQRELQNSTHSTPLTRTRRL